MNISHLNNTKWTNNLPLVLKVLELSLRYMLLLFLCINLSKKCIDEIYQTYIVLMLQISIYMCTYKYMAPDMHKIYIQVYQQNPKQNIRFASNINTFTEMASIVPSIISLSLFISLLPSPSTMSQSFMRYPL